MRIYNGFVRSDRSLSREREKKKVRFLFAISQSTPDSFDQKNNNIRIIRQQPNKITNIKESHTSQFQWEII